MNFDSKQKFSIRKYSIGVASVLLGTFLMGVGIPTDDVHADEVSGDSLEAAANESTSDLLVSNQITGNETVESNKGMSTEAVQNVDMSSASESKNLIIQIINLKKKKFQVWWRQSQITQKYHRNLKQWLMKIMGSLLVQRNQPVLRLMLIPHFVVLDKLHHV